MPFYLFLISVIWVLKRGGGGGGWGWGRGSGTPPPSSHTHTLFTRQNKFMSFYLLFCTPSSKGKNSHPRPHPKCSFFLVRWIPIPKEANLYRLSSPGDVSLCFICHPMLANWYSSCSLAGSLAPRYEFYFSNLTKVRYSSLTIFLHILSPLPDRNS